MRLYGSLWYVLILPLNSTLNGARLHTMHATLASITDHSASQDSSGRVLLVLVTMMRTTENRTTNIPRANTPISASRDRHGNRTRIASDIGSAMIRMSVRISAAVLRRRDRSARVAFVCEAQPTTANGSVMLSFPAENECLTRFERSARDRIADNRSCISEDCDSHDGPPRNDMSLQVGSESFEES